MMNKKVPLGVTISLMILVAALTFSISMIFAFRGIAPGFSVSATSISTERKLKEIDRLVSANFFDDVDPDQLSDSVASGYMSGLNDPYSFYYSQSDYAREQQNTQGKGIGIGINIIENEQGYIEVYSVNRGTPAEEAGIRPGDMIIRVGNQDVLSLGYTQAYSALLGEEGTHCLFTLRRGEIEMEMDVVRLAYETISVESRMIGEIGYMKITGFHENTPAQFDDALQELMKQNAKGLLFDMRGNGGGTLDSVAKILDTLLPEGDIVSATYKGGKTDVLFTSDAQQVDLPMDVLIDNGTASAAELFSAAIRDYNKGKLIGETSYGKGVMQRTYELADGSAVKVTIAQFNPPSGENFNGVGLSPDIEVVLTEEQQERFLSMTDEEDPQLQAALKDLR